jgi:NADPH:quinone reductase-like Zn-dependent oxidoreductase
MRAWRVHEHGPPSTLRLDELPLPEPGPGEVRVRVGAVALNHLDLWVRRGVPGHRFPLPIIPGCDVAGTVDALGPGAGGIEPGATVLAAPGMGCGRCTECLGGDDYLCRFYGILGETRDGGCAEALCLPATHVVSPPRDLPL